MSLACQASNLAAEAFQFSRCDLLPGTHSNLAGTVLILRATGNKGRPNSNLVSTFYLSLLLLSLFPVWLKKYPTILFSECHAPQGMYVLLCLSPFSRKE
jgi:hypothetical protein